MGLTGKLPKIGFSAVGRMPSLKLCHTHFLCIQVPFGLRLIWAELAAHTGKIQESLDRLYYLLMIIQQVSTSLIFPCESISFMTLLIALLWSKPFKHVLYKTVFFALQILSNLDSGSTPDGSPMKLSAQSRQEGTRIWSSRRLRVKYAIANALCQIKDYDNGLKLFEEIVEEEEEEDKRRSVLTGIGRLLLQVC